MAVGAASLHCSLCQCEVAEAEERAACPGCGTQYHAECWKENGGCGRYGCAQVPATEKRTDLEMPAGHWGKDTKPCPKCGAEIVAAALRCRHCGATFATAAPQSRGEFATAAAAGTQVSRLRARVWWVLVAALFPPTAVVVACAGWWWYRANPGPVRSLPGLQRGVLQIALLVSAVITVLFPLAVIGMSFLH